MFKVQNSKGQFSPAQALVDSSGRVVLSPTGVGADIELVVTTYSCSTAFTGASIGDMITSTQAIDVSGTPTTTGVIWRNQTTATDLASAPSIANLTITSGQALTNAQLRASAIAVDGSGVTQPVSAVALPLPAGAATADAQATIVTNMGAKADAAATSDTGTFSIIAFIKRGLQNWTALLAKIPALGAAAKAASIPVTLATDQPAVPVSGTFFQATQPISLPSNSFANIAASTTTAVKGSAGTLRSLTINTKGTGATATLYDSLTGSGTKIATIDLTLSQETLTYNLAFATGLTVVTAGATPADITVTYN